MRIFAPWLPPTTNIRKVLRPLLTSVGGVVVTNSFLRGFPVQTALARAGKLSGKACSTTLAILANSRLVVPGILFCSWMTSGIPRTLLINPPGPATNPPIPRTTSGLRLRRMVSASMQAFINIRGALITASRPFPRSPETESQSNAMPFSGTTRFSKPLCVPIQLTRQPLSCRLWATASAGNTCPPVPPAIITMHLSIPVFP